MVGTIVAALGTVGLYWQISLTRKAVEDTSRATEAMREGNAIARESLQVSNRPWIYVMPTGKGHVKLDALSITIQFNVKNIGNYAAHDLTIKHRFVRPILVAEPGGAQVIEPEDSADFFKEIGPADGDMLFPNEENPWTILETVGADRIEYQDVPIFGRNPMTHMQVCCRYKSNGKAHMVGRTFMVVATQANGQGVWIDSVPLPIECIFQFVPYGKVYTDQDQI